LGGNDWTGPPFDVKSDPGQGRASADILSDLKERRVAASFCDTASLVLSSIDFLSLFCSYSTRQQ
jgi:hypothetical protein